MSDGQIILGKQGWTTSGVYHYTDTVFFEEGVIHPYHPAVPGTVEKFKGIMLTLFDEFSVSAEDLENISRKRDYYWEAEEQ